MGLVLALSVFIYPLALPIATLVEIFSAAASLELGLLVSIRRGVAKALVLTLLLGPGVVSSDAGSFLLPWWLHWMVGHAGVSYYIGEYFAACVLLFLVFLAVVAAWRSITGGAKRT